MCKIFDEWHYNMQPHISRDYKQTYIKYAYLHFYTYAIYLVCKLYNDILLFILV